MSKQVVSVYQGPGKLLELAMSAVLLALSIVLHFFKLPYPPAPFLKFDGVGIPLAVLALYSLRASVAVLPLVFVGLILLGADIVGAAMKVLAELTTFLPLVFLYNRRLDRVSLIIPPVIASRAVSMAILNLIVSPYWLSLTYGWSYEKSFSATIALLPHVALFNAIAASYVTIIGLGTFRVVSKVLGTDRRAR